MPTTCQDLIVKSFHAGKDKNSYGASYRRHKRLVEESACKIVLFPRKLSPHALSLSHHEAEDSRVCLRNVTPPFRRIASVEQLESLNGNVGRLDWLYQRCTTLRLTRIDF
ncbi:hypothetical protein TorRG33x02_325170, partial [Trema orientale]